MKIYTKQGDLGSTRLCSGECISKDCCQVEAYGAVDELNASIGVAGSLVESELKEILLSVQKDLFVVGSDLASKFSKKEVKRVDSGMVERLERIIDRYTEELPELNKFILPAGSQGISQLHSARAVCRRAEREIINYARDNEINPDILKYMNRLSDLLFILARIQAKKEGVEEVIV